MANILIVDDHPDNRALLLSLLGYGGHTLSEAADGAEALERVRRERFDLVVTDVLMPRVDGYELVRQLRANLQIAQPRIIFVTATYLEAEATMLARACGVRHFMLKPIEPQTFLDLVAAVLAEPAPVSGISQPSGEVVDEHLRLLTDKLHRHVIQLEQLNRELDQRVAERTRELEVANRELEAFSYSVSHDLRAPLRHIDGYARMLMDDAERYDEGTQQRLTAISAAAKRMSQLIDALLNLSRLGRTALRPRSVDMSVQVQEVREELMGEIKDRVVRWNIGPLPVVNCDAVLLRQVWINLLSNALKYSAPRAEAIVEVGTGASEGEKTVFFVRDNGVGFNAQYGGRLFNTFQRLHDEHEFSGIGIGLAIVRRIVERHGGRVWAVSAEGKGATFYFSLAATAAPN